MDYKKYIYSLFPFILFSFFIFVFSIFYGYFYIYSSYDAEELINNYLNEALSFFTSATELEQFFFVFINNAVLLFFTIFLGIFFAVFPFFILFINGLLIGIVANYFREMGEISFFIIGIIPHGIIEIPLIIISGAIGLKIGKNLFDKLLKKEVNIKEEIYFAFIFFSRILFPIVFLAAIIEIFLTSNILKYFF